MSNAKPIETGSDPLTFVRLAEEGRWLLLELYGLDDPKDLIDGKQNPQPDGKRPKGAAWQTRGKLAAVGRVTTWRERGSNFGLLPGPSGLAVLDVEPTGLSTWPSERFPVGYLLVRTPSGGLHAYLDLAAVERVLGGKLAGKLNAPGAELISHGGQVVIPPSRARSRKALDPATGRYDRVQVGEYVIEQMGEPIADQALLVDLLAPFRPALAERNGHESRNGAPAAPSGITTVYGRKVLDAELARIAKADVGARHPTFIKRAPRVYAYVAGGEIEEREAEEMLRAAWTTAVPDPARAHELEELLRAARVYGFAAPKCSRKRKLLRDLAARGELNEHEVEELGAALSLRAIEAAMTEPVVEVVPARPPESTPSPEIQPEEAPADLTPDEQSEVDKAYAQPEPEPPVADKLRAAVEKVKKSHSVGGPAEPPPPGAIVIAEGQLPRVVADVERVLAHSARVYRRGQLLVVPSRVEHEAKPKPGQPRRSRGVLHAPLASEAALVEIAMRCAEFVRQDLRTETGWKKTDLPTRYAGHVLARVGDWPNVPDLHGLAESPILRPDGTVASAPGYDASSGYLLGLAIDFPPVPERPTRAEAERALALLREPLAEFPFTSDAARSVALSSMLSPLARPAMRTVPGHAFDAPTMGSGKTLLADLPALLATGRSAAANQVPEGEEELRKMLLALAIEADPLIVLDNAEGSLRSGSLAAAMTAETIRGRVLGLSKNATATWSACVFITGNNVALAGDVSTRFLRCRIDAGVESPEERDAFKIADLRAWVLDHRAELVAAALTVLRWGVLLAEMPQLRRFGRFEDFDRVVRAPLVALNQADPGDTRTELRAEDPAREARVELLASLRELFGGAEFTAEAATEKLAPDTADRAKAARALGYRLRAARDLPTSGLLLLRVGEGHGGKVRWRVEARA